MNKNKTIDRIPTLNFEIVQFAKIKSHVIVSFYIHHFGRTQNFPLQGDRFADV